MDLSRGCWHFCLASSAEIGVCRWFSSSCASGLSLVPAGAALTLLPGASCPKVYLRALTCLGRLGSVNLAAKTLAFHARSGHLRSLCMAIFVLCLRFEKVSRSLAHHRFRWCWVILVTLFSADAAGPGLTCFMRVFSTSRGKVQTG